MTIPQLRNEIQNDSLKNLKAFFVLLANNYAALKPEAQGDCRERMCVVSNVLFSRSIAADTMQEREEASKLYHACAAEILALPPLSPEAIAADNAQMKAIAETVMARAPRPKLTIKNVAALKVQSTELRSLGISIGSFAEADNVVAIRRNIAAARATLDAIESRLPAQA